jgi:SAM-dependent methyltransferase
LVLARRSHDLRSFIGDVRGLTVLDVGSGTGVTLAMLAEARLRIGVDLSMGMLRRSLATASLSEPMLLVNASADSLPAIDAAFDRTLCMDMLQYLDDPSAKRALSELVRVTAPGGQLILSVRNSHSPVGVTRRLAGDVRRLLRRPRAAVEYYRSPGWYRTALSGSATLRETYAYGLHPIGVGPAGLLRWTETVEDRAQRAVFGRSRFGVHQFMRFDVAGASRSRGGTE